MSKTPLVIFGSGHLAELAWEMFRNGGEFEPVAFSVERAFMDAVPNAQFCGLPVLALEDLPRSRPADDHSFFIAAGPHGCNGLRARIFEWAETQNYRLATHVEPDARVATGVEVGKGSLVFSGVRLDWGTRLGANCVYWTDTLISHHSTVENHCYFAPRAAISGCCVIGTRSYVGTNATLRDHITLAPESLVGCGSVVQSNTEPGAIYPGPKARRRLGLSAEIRL